MSKDEEEAREVATHSDQCDFEIVGVGLQSELIYKCNCIQRVATALRKAREEGARSICRCNCHEPDWKADRHANCEACLDALLLEERELAKAEQREEDARVAEAFFEDWTPTLLRRGRDIAVAIRATLKPETKGEGK